MASASTPPLGLRERKKIATRAALSECALRLAVERGFDQVRVDDIAAMAGVSPRTFNNYFSSKEEAIICLLTERVLKFRRAIATYPVDDPLWDVIAESAVALVPVDEELDRWRRWVELIKGTPSLEAEYLRANAALEQDLVLEIAERTGVDSRLDFYPRLAACVAVAAIRGALQFWLENHRTSNYSSLLNRAIREVGVALPTPTR